MSNLVIPDGGTIGSASDTDAITISSTGKVTTADSELNVKAVNGSTTHTFTVKGIGETIYEDDGTTVVDSDSGQFAVYNGSTKLLGITEHGYVLKPNTPVFRVGLNANSTFGANAICKFNTTSVEGGCNIGNCYSTTTGQFTAPVAGYYYFSANVLWMSLANNTSMNDSFRFRKNAVNAQYSWRRSDYVSGTTGSSGYFSDFSTTSMLLQANDTVDVYLKNDEDVHGNKEYTCFQGHLVG